MPATLCGDQHLPHPSVLFVSHNLGGSASLAARSPLNQPTLSQGTPLGDIAVVVVLTEADRD